MTPQPVRRFVPLQGSASLTALTCTCAACNGAGSCSCTCTECQHIVMHSMTNLGFINRAIPQLLRSTTIVWYEAFGHIHKWSYVVLSQRAAPFVPLPVHGRRG